MADNVVRTISFRGTSEGLDELTAKLREVASEEKNIALVSDDLSKRTISLAAAWKQTGLRLDETARAQDNYNRLAKQSADLLKQQGISAEQHAERLKLLGDRYGQVSASSTKLIAGMTAAGDVGAVASQRMISGMSGAATQIGHVNVETSNLTKQSSRSAAEMLNLSRQVADVGVSLQAGQSLFTVFVQQGAQIVDVFASSNRTVGQFFSQAIGWAGRFLTSTVGIVTGITAIGAAAVYAAVQFVRASTTIEEALENQNRLLKEGKALIDARTSAEARAQLNPKDLTEYELKRNLLDVQRKLNEEARGALIRTAPRPNISGDIRGEFAGEAPLTPGMNKIIDATTKLKAAQAAGLPGMKEYNAELGRIATAHPELAKTVDKMIELGRTGIELENAEMRLKAMSDALKGVATDAQMAAVGLGSVAQFQLNNRQANEAKEATERQAQAVLQMAQAYPGMSIEVAKQLDTAKGQLAVTQQITGAAQIQAQWWQTITATQNQHLSLSERIALADAQRAEALARVETAAKQQLKSLKEENELINARSERERDSIRSRQTYNKLIEEGVSEEMAAAVAAQQLTNATDQRVKAYRQATAAAEQELYVINAMAAAAASAQWSAMAFVPQISQSLGGQLYQSKQGGYSQFNPAGYQSSWKTDQYYALQDQYGPGGFDEQTGAPNAQGLEYQFNKSGGALSTNIMESPRYVATGGIEPAWMSSGLVDMSKVSLAQRSIELLPKEQQAAPLQGLIKSLQNAPYSLATAEAIKSLTEKLEQLTQATDANTSATSAMTDVLSPFYSSDPRRTHLGFRAFAQGGIMTQYGELPLRHYQGGGMATSPQVAVFGEGSTPEAYVPAPGGQIPVVIKTPANSNRPVNVTINVMGNADAGTVAALKQTSFQKAQQLRRITG